MITELIKEYVLEHSGAYYLYDLGAVIQQINTAKLIQAPYGTTIRYAMKANPTVEIMKLMLDEGIWIDACSEFEAKNAIHLGFDASQVQLCAQQLPNNIQETVSLGIEFVATSLHQLESYGKIFPGTKVGVRINPGFGDGQFAKVNVGGKESGFGIRREYLDQVNYIAEQYQLIINKVHTHIGSGTNPDIWAEVAAMSLEICNHFPQAEILNLGGGFKVARMDYENAADMKIIGEKIASIFTHYYEKTKRKMKLEIEPGTFMVANAGYIACNVIDIVDTGKGGYHFIRLDTGMDMIVRPTMYGSQHPIIVLPSQVANNQLSVTSIKPNSEELKAKGVNVMEGGDPSSPINDPSGDGGGEYVFIGHCCESSDLLSPSKDNPNAIYPRHLDVEPYIGDRVIIGGCGAYCQSMSMKGYNGWPEAEYRIVS